MVVIEGVFGQREGDKSGIMMTEMVAAFNGGPSNVGDFKHRFGHIDGASRTRDWNFRDCVIGDLKSRQVNV